MKAQPPKKSTSKRAAGGGTRTGKRPDSARRMGGDNKTRADLLDAAEALMRAEGYAAVSVRNLANLAKLTPQLVHYYFRSMDDLFVALWRRFVDKNVERQAGALESDEPLRALWDFATTSSDTSLEAEFLALANHRKSVQEEIARDGDKFRRLQFDLLSQKLANKVADCGGASPEILVILLTSIARSLVIEKNLGLSAGHDATHQYMERWIDALQAPSRSKRRRS